MVVSYFPHGCAQMESRVDIIALPVGRPHHPLAICKKASLRVWGLNLHVLTSPVCQNMSVEVELIYSQLLVLSALYSVVGRSQALHIRAFVDASQNALPASYTEECNM